MRYKYIEEKYKPIYIFGENKEAGKVDIANIDGDILNSVDKKQAESIIKMHDVVLERLCEISCLFDNVNPEIFEWYWYGKRDKEWYVKLKEYEKEGFNLRKKLSSKKPSFFSGILRAIKPNSTDNK